MGNYGEWVLTAVSMTGVVLNIYKNRFCFVIWAGTNFFWMVVDFAYGIYSQAFLFFVYFCLALFGFWKWHKDSKMGSVSCAL